MTTKCAWPHMWILKRLAQMGVGVESLLLTYTSRIRTHLEQNVPLWHFTISQKLSKGLEKVQRACAYLILGKLATTDYYCNLTLLNLEPLVDRRDELCLNFAKKTFKHPEHSKLFKKPEASNTRTQRKVIVPVSKSARYNRSSIPSLARIINSKL